MNQKVVNASNVIQISGDNHAPININVTPPTATEAKARKVTAKPAPPPDAINDAQKSVLQGLIADWVELSGKLKQTPITPQAAWSKMNRKVKVATYHNIRACDFESAKKFIQVEMGMLRSMKSAHIKDEKWRKSRITAIQTISKKHDLNVWRMAYMRKNFEAASMTELMDEQLDKLYHAITAKKPKS